MTSSFRNITALGTILLGIFFATIAVLQPINFPLLGLTIQQKAVVGFCTSVDIALTGALMLWSWKHRRPLIHSLAGMMPLAFCAVLSTVTIIIVMA